MTVKELIGRLESVFGSESEAHVYMMHETDVPEKCLYESAVKDVASCVSDGTQKYCIIIGREWGDE